jgi:hypothetical protein
MGLFPSRPGRRRTRRRARDAVGAFLGFIRQSVVGCRRLYPPSSRSNPPSSAGCAMIAHRLGPPTVRCLLVVRSKQPTPPRRFSLNRARHPIPETTRLAISNTPPPPPPPPIAPKRKALPEGPLPGRMRWLKPGSPLPHNARISRPRFRPPVITTAAQNRSAGERQQIGRSEQTNRRPSGKSCPKLGRSLRTSAPCRPLIMGRDKSRTVDFRVTTNPGYRSTLSWSQHVRGVRSACNPKNLKKFTLIKKSLVSIPEGQR